MVNPAVINALKHTPVRHMRKNNTNQAPKQHINRVMPAVSDLARRKQKRNKPRKHPDDQLPMLYPPLPSTIAKVSLVLTTPARHTARQRARPSLSNNLQFAVEVQGQETEAGKRSA